MQNETKERIIAQIKERQDRYVDGQLDLYDRILQKVEKQYENAISYTVLSNIAAAIYEGYSPNPCGRCDYCRANQLTQRVEIY